jgi:hypothetical protein
VETWTIDGVPLLTLAADVQRVDSAVVPPLRGDDRRYAFRPGAEYRPRVTDSGSLTLGLWLLGMDGPGSTSAAWEANYAGAERQLRRLLRPDGGREFTISKTWTDDLGSHTATGRGIAGSIERARSGRFAGRLTVDIGMADPFFYGSAVAVNLPAGAAVVVDNPGDALTTALTLDLAGQLSNPKVTNSTGDDVWVKLGTDIAGGDSIRADVLTGSVLRDSDGANLIGTLTHSGARPWLLLRRGANTVTLTTDSGAGSGVLTFQPVYY